MAFRTDDTEDENKGEYFVTYTDFTGYAFSIEAAAALITRVFNLEQENANLLTRLAALEAAVFPPPPRDGSD